MNDELTVGDLFQRSPTRGLEEVQKVDTTGDRAQAEEDIAEFVETDSSRRVVSRLCDLLDPTRVRSPRLLYVHATFGSGKSHLLKLIGLATGQVPGCERSATRLAEQFSSFRELRGALEGSGPALRVPVFLNLLDRNPATDPPLAYLVYLALSRRLGYPTDPVWLAEWAWQIDREAGLWENLQSAESGDGQSLDDAVQERAFLRPWLRNVVPGLPGAEEAGLSNPELVKESIRAAEETAGAVGFDGARLSEHLKEARSILDRRVGEEVGFVLGLDEVALWVGDSERRFEQFQSTIEALRGEDEPIVIGTGQWSLAGMADHFYGEVPERWMREQEVRLHAADSEVIVRNRWLSKKPQHTERLEEILEATPAGVLGRAELDTAEDPVVSYPFLPGDLRHFREAMEAILTAGADTDRDYVQGRALLVYVRALFTDFGWDGKPLGRVVPWDILFDLLHDEGSYIPEWVPDLLGMVQASMEGTSGLALRVAKALYLLNHVPSLEASGAVVAAHLVADLDEDLDALERDVARSLDALEDKHLVYADTVEDETVFRLLSREEVSVSQKIRQQRVSPAEIRWVLEEWLQDHERLVSEGVRREIDLGEERQVPMRNRYSVLSHNVGSTASSFDAATMRVHVHWEDVDDTVQRWKSQNEERGTEGEDVMVALSLTEAFHDRLDRAIATQRVLEQENRRIRELEVRAREERAELRRQFQGLLIEAELHVPDEAEPVGRFGPDLDRLLAGRVVPRKFPDRKVLSRGLRETDDARQLQRFFSGEGTWPWSEADASLLGVDLKKRSITDDGWVEEFLSRYENGAFIAGEELLDRIESRSGDLLGTPLESLQALLLTAALGRQVTLRSQGEDVLEVDAIARMVRNKSATERVTLKVAPPEEAGRTEELEKIYETLSGETVTDTSPSELLEKAGRWARRSVGMVREVDRRLRRGTTTSARLTELLAALAPAEAGEPLKADDLLEENVRSEAERFQSARRYFGGDLEDLWNRLETSARLLRACYPSASVTRRISRYFSEPILPEPEAVDRLVAEAERVRRDRLRSLLDLVLEDSPEHEDLEALTGTLRDGIHRRSDELLAEMEERSDELDGKIRLPHLRDLVKLAGDEPERLSSERLEAQEVADDAALLGRARRLTEGDEDGEGESLWMALEEARRTVSDRHPDSPLLSQLEHGLEGPSLPDPERARRLVDQSRQAPGEAADEEGEVAIPADLEQRLAELSEGAIVAVMKGVS